VSALRIGSRGSALALWQARSVAAALTAAGTPSEVLTISTHGDQQQNMPLTAIGGKGVFVTEIHDALLRGDIDLAVHSAKDLPAVSPAGLMIGAVLPREDPRDVFVLPLSDPHAVAQPVTGAPSNNIAPSFRAALTGRSVTIGTGSPRRVAQLRRILPAARFEPIRGNVDTRLRKLDAGEVEALVLACAGLHRLGLEHRITFAIAVSDCVPAPGQGMIAVEVRSRDDQACRLVAPINDDAARVTLAAEQSVVAALGGGCQLPLGAFAEVRGRELSIRARVVSSDGTTVIESDITGSALDPVEAGTRLARELASRGACELLKS